VPERGSPSVRRRQLAAELRRLRDRAGLTGDQVAGRFGWSPSKISRIETSQTGISSADLRQLMDLYEASEADRSLLTALARESGKTRWIDSTLTAEFAPGYAAYVYAEAEAATARDWEPQVVAGLLQTEQYARHTFSGWNSMFRLPAGDIDALVAARVLRQQVLTREQPLELSVVLDESVLRRRFGDATVMQQQLRHLAAVSELPHIDIRILSLDGNHPIGSGTFVYMQFAQIQGISLPDIVFTEDLNTNYYTEDRAATNQFRVAFEQLQADAHDRTTSRDLISRAAAELWS